MPFLAAAPLWLVIALTSFAPAQVPASFASAQKPASLVSAHMPASFASAQKPPIDWTPIRAESLRHFRALVQIDTSNPPGNEIKAVEYLQKVLTAESIPSRTLALDPNRPNLVARLKGTGAKRPLLLLGSDFAQHSWHSDVERLSEDSLHQFVEYMWTVVSAAIAGK